MMTLSTKSVRKIGLTLLAPMFFFAGQSCTSLTEVPHDALTPDNAFKTDAEILAGVAGVYAQLRPVEWVGYMTLQDLTTDVAIVPTRGSDWYDNGQWLDLHRQTYTPNSSGTLAFVDGAWNDMFSGVAKANLMIDVITKSGLSQARKDSALAELKTLRAWDYYMLQDMFGAVPIVATTELKQYARNPRSAVFNFIEKDLLDSRAFLPDKWDAANAGRVTKGAANAILASLYINSGVFSKDAGVSTSAYNSCTTATVTGGTGCAAAISAADAVINSGQYSLSTVWANNFGPDNKNSTENIFVIVHTKDGTQGIGGNWPMRTLHYNQLNTGWGSPWNGFATIAETYNAFDAADDRRGMWLVGQGKSFETGQNVNDRTGAPLIFTVNITDVNAASEGEGVRFNKFPPIPSAATGSGQPADFPMYRLAEMYLIKAEALNEQGSTAAALVELNRIHNLHDAANPITAATQAQIRDAILKERLLEFSAEGKRRSDLIRMGKFLTWTEASKNGVCGATGVCSGSRAAFRILFPIPATQLGSNPLLTQNTGY
jgi:starch-binding outer membrane protein, SusD/RagB family